MKKLALALIFVFAPSIVHAETIYWSFSGALARQNSQQAYYLFGNLSIYEGDHTISSFHAFTQLDSSTQNPIVYPDLSFDSAVDTVLVSNFNFYDIVTRNFDGRSFELKLDFGTGINELNTTQVIPFTGSEFLVGGDPAWTRYTSGNNFLVDHGINNSPEPASLGLLVIGIAMISFLSRKYKSPSSTN